MTRTPHLYHLLQDTMRRAYRIAPLVCSFLLLSTLVASSSAQTFTSLHSFGRPPGATAPVGELIQDEQGNMYGTTTNGGSSFRCGNSPGPSGCGTIFEFDVNGNEIVLHSFDESHGALPTGRLARDKSGNLYGTTFDGGPSNMGIVFKFDTTNRKFRVLHAFTGDDGARPSGPVIRDGSGNLYGATSEGGANNQGTIFRVDAAGNETVLYSFAGVPDGRSPNAPLSADADGVLYGTTLQGGDADGGTVFKLDPNGVETVLYSFKGFPSDGAGPQTGLTRGKDGNLYGTAVSGGPSGWGIVFMLDDQNNEHILHSFAGREDGGSPGGVLVEDAFGNFYGKAARESVRRFGNIFMVDATGRFRVIHHFTGPDGEGPAGGVILDSQRNLFAMTTRGGAENFGTIFQIHLD